MNWVDETIAAFGQTIGIPGLALDPNGRLDLELQGGEAISIRQPADSAPDMFLVTRSAPLGFDPAPRLRAALRLADFRRSRSRPARAAIEDESLVLAMAIRAREFTPDALEQALAGLMRLHVELAGDAGR